MQTVQFIVPGLGTADRADLANALITITGVAHVDLDSRSHTVTVEFDPDYSNPTIIKGCIVGAGYPVDGKGQRG